MRKIGCFLTLAALCTALSTPAMNAASADSLAARVLSQLGRSKGVTAIPNCGNGQLVRAFLAASGMKVHAMDSVQANIDATRQLVEPTGKIGPVCTVDKGTLALMPYVNRFVDCIVITNLTDADLARVSYAEIQRVLAPDGLAFVGRAAAEGAGITQAAIQTWINAATRSRSTATVSTTGGTWAVIIGTELSGVDVWPRHNYDSTGSNYSKDSVAAFPWLPQAKMKPYQQLSEYFALGTTTVTSGGRLYEVAQEVPPEGHCASGACPPQSAQMLRAYSIYNGEQLWTREIRSDGVGGLGADPIRAFGRDVYLMRASGGILQLNGITGEVVGTVSSVPEARPLSALVRPTDGVDGCTPYHASIYYTFNGTGKIGYDFRQNIPRASHFYKPSCGILGTIISNGMMVFMRPSCTCGSSRLWGSNIDGPGLSFQFDRSAAANGSDRIEQGPAYGAVTTVVSPDGLDWPTHRGNISRTGSTPVPIATMASAVHLMWNWQPPFNYVTQATTLMFDARPEQEPTPPVVAGSYAFIGGTDGYVRCLDNASGAQVWSYLTGGRIYGTPTVWSGRVYVGSVDGYAYCIEAHTGRLIWRFRGAPTDMRFNLFGYLSSVWPVLTGVMVDANGNAYFAAGVQCEYGTHVYCIDATTGALKWQNNNCGTALNPTERLGTTPCGYMTIAGNRLIMASSVPAVASFDLSTGTMDSTFAQFSDFALNVEGLNYIARLVRTGYPLRGATRGREVGIVNNSYFITGGYTIFRDPTFRSNADWTIYDNHQFMFQKLGATGTPLYPATAINKNSSVTSAWDTAQFCQMMAGDRRLECYRMSGLIDTLDKRVSLPGTEYDWCINKDIGNASVTAAAPTWMPTPLFSNTALYFNAMVLAPNALVATYAKADPKVPENVAWYVGALNRTTGATLWEIALPDVGTGLKGAPLHQGLAIDRNGNVIVALYNGNVLCYGSGPATSVALPNEVVDRARPAVVPAAPALPTAVPQHSPEAAAAADASDLVVRTDGVAVHAYPPSVRCEMVPLAGAPADTLWEPQSACLGVVSVSAGSTEGRASDACHTLDRDLRTRWSPARGDALWVAYDLGKVCEVSSVSLVWHVPRSGQTIVKVDLSQDGKEYRTVDSGALEGKGTNEALRSFVPAEAQFVRVILDAPVSLYEVGIHGVDVCRR